MDNKGVSIGFIQRFMDGKNLLERVSLWSTTSGLDDPEIWTDTPEFEFGIGWTC